MDLQVLYRVQLYLGGKWLDVTNDVSGQITYKESKDLTTELSLTFRRGTYDYTDILAVPGTKIRFWGGGKQTGLGVSNSSLNYRHFFTGTCYKPKPNFPDDGVPTISVTCYDNSATNSALSEESYTYPSQNSKRTWANRETIRASQIIRYIVEEEMKCVLGDLKLAEGADFTFGRIPNKANGVKAPVVQSNMTDLEFLRRFSESLGAVFYPELIPESGLYKVNVVSSSLAQGEVSPLSFMYPERAGDSTFINNELLPNQLQLYSVSVDVETYAATAVNRVVERWNPETGEVESNINSWDAEREQYVVFDGLDEAKIASLSESERSELSDRTFLLSVPFNEIKKYFLQKTEETAFATDQWVSPPPVRLGYALTASCPGNVNIRTNAYYPIDGVGAFSTKGDSRRRWYLQEITHTWDSIYSCNLEFVR
jgi:hypothetical protein